MSPLRSLFFFPCLVALFLTIPSAAEAASAKLTPENRTQIARAEAYLNGISTLKARFVQSAANGNQVEGLAYLSRPGKMRLEYDPPSPLLIVADGTFLIVHDKELGDPSYIPLGSTPAGTLVRPNVRLDGGELMVTGVQSAAGVLEIAVRNAEEPGQGELTLVFTQSPFALRQWRVVDAQGIETRVSLYDIQTGGSLPAALFEFKDPKLTEPKLHGN